MRKRTFSLAAGLFLLAALALVVAGCGSSKSSASLKLTYGKPIAVTQPQLVEYEKQVKHHVYWIGAYKGFTYELTETKNGNSYVRYLPAAVKVGTAPGKYTIIGTYPSSNAYAAVTADIKKYKMDSHPVAYSGIAAWSPKHLTSVYLVYPKLKQLIEIYDPEPAKTKALALGGLVEPVSMTYP